MQTSATCEEDSPSRTLFFGCRDLAQKSTMTLKQRTLGSAEVKGNELHECDLLSLVSTHTGLYWRGHLCSQEGSWDLGHRPC